VRIVAILFDAELNPQLMTTYKSGDESSQRATGWNSKPLTSLLSGMSFRRTDSEGAQMFCYFVLSEILTQRGDVRDKGDLIP
jgi:hypothetical protein